MLVDRKPHEARECQVSRFLFGSTRPQQWKTERCEQWTQQLKARCVSIESLVRAHLASHSCSVFLALSEKLLNEGQQHNISCHIWQNNPKNKCITLREDSKDSFQFNCPFKEFRKWLYCPPVIIILMRRKHDLCCGGQISSVWLDMIQESSTFPSRLPEFTQIK